MQLSKNSFKIFVAIAFIFGISNAAIEENTKTGQKQQKQSSKQNSHQNPKSLEKDQENSSDEGSECKPYDLAYENLAKNFVDDPEETLTGDKEMHAKNTEILGIVLGKYLCDKSQSSETPEKVNFKKDKRKWTEKGARDFSVRAENTFEKLNSEVDVSHRDMMVS